MHLFSPLGSCARSHYCFMCTCSCCTLVLAPWFMCTCSLLVHVVHFFSPLGSCTRSHYWLMLYTCSRPLVHMHLFSLLVHVVHLFSPLGSCALVLTTGSCCTLALAPWFLCTCSHYWFMLYTCSCPLVHEHLFSLLFHVHLF